MGSRHCRTDVVIATKFGSLLGVSRRGVAEAVDASLRRLRTDHIDLLYAHIDDAAVPLDETLGAVDELVRAGKALAAGASGYSAGRLAEALAISDREGWSRYVAVQPHFNLMERSGYEGELQRLAVRERLACFPFFALARGFLTGKYRPGRDVDTRRGEFAWSEPWDERSRRVLAALDDIAAAHETTVAAVALAWAAAQPTVRAPIASARSPQQLAALLPMLQLTLTADEVAELDGASRGPAVAAGA
jgi:aryl-alcohol dehydrogenase (NADP+)